MTLRLRTFMVSLLGGLLMMLSASTGSVPLLPTARALAAGCDALTGQSSTLVSYQSNYTHDGTLAGWQLRTVAGGNADGARATTEMWVGTYGAGISTLTSFVEVGLIDGYFSDGQQHHSFFSERHRPDGTWDDFLFTGLPTTLGHYVTVQVAKYQTGSVRAKVTDSTSGNFGYKNWGDASGPYSHWGVGEEFTCSFSSIAGTTVFDNQYRRSSDGLWLSPETGNRKDLGTSSGAFGWCYEPETFEYAKGLPLPSPDCT